MHRYHHVPSRFLPRRLVYLSTSRARCRFFRGAALALLPWCVRRRGRAIDVYDRDLLHCPRWIELVAETKKQVSKSRGGRGGDKGGPTTLLWIQGAPSHAVRCGAPHGNGVVSLDFPRRRSLLLLLFLKHFSGGFLSEQSRTPVRFYSNHREIRKAADSREAPQIAQTQQRRR